MQDQLRKYGAGMTSSMTLLLQRTAVADEAVARSQAPAGFDATSLLSFGSSMVAVIGAILLLGWLYRRSQAYRGGSASVINIIAAQSLGPKERILLVDVAGEQLVLGMTASQVQTLHVLSEPVVSEEPVALSGGFAERLRASIRGMKS